MSARTIQIPYIYYNGELLEQGQSSITIRVDRVHPMGVNVVKIFNSSLDCVAKRLFLFRVGMDVFGTTYFKDIDDFWVKIRGVSSITYNGCYVTSNMCFLILK